MKYLITIVLFLFSVSVFAQSNITAIYNNWFDNNGNWVLTLTENSAIYKNQTWNYKIESVNGNKISLQFRNGQNTKRILLTLNDSSSIDISFDSQNLVSQLTNRQRVRIPLQNNKVRTKPELVTINGFVKNSTKYFESSTLEFEFGDWLTGNYRVLFAKIDTSGFFSLTFLQHYPEEFSVSYRKKYIRLYMVPADTITLFLNADMFPKETLLMSKHADIAYNVADYEMKSGNRVSTNSEIEQIRSTTLNPKAYKSWRDSLYNADLTYVSEYILRNEKVDFFQKWLADKYKYAYISDLVQNYTLFRTKNKSEPFDSSYLSLLDSVSITDSSGIANEGLYSVMNRFNNLFYILASTRPDTKGITMYFQDNKTEKSKLTLNTSEKKTIENAEPKFVSKKEAVSADEYIKEVKQIKNELVRDALIANCYDRFKKYYNSDTLAFKLYSNIENDLVKSRFSEKYMHDKEMLSGGKLDLNASDDGQILLNEIISKNKNKVIYLDFWGTFCGPCLNDFKGSSELKEYYKKKDVAFVYLCERGEESKWQEIIKQYSVKGDHYLLNNHQYIGLAKMFNLTYVPRYIIIDKNGNVVDFNAPRPWNELEIKSLINKYLNIKM